MEIKEIHSFEAKLEKEFVDIQNSLKNKIRLLNGFKVED